MVYCPREIAHDRCDYFSFWASFCPFTPLKAQKIKISKKWKKRPEILSFYTCVPKIMIRWYTVPEIWCATDGQPDSRTHGREKLPVEVGSLPKNDHFLVFLAVWVIFPKFWVGKGVTYVNIAQNNKSVTCSCIPNCFYFVLWAKLAGKSAHNYEKL